MTRIFIGLLVVVFIAGLLLTIFNKFQVSSREVRSNLASPSTTSIQPPSLSPYLNDSHYLFEYLEKVDKSQFSVLGEVVEAWRVDVRRELLANNSSIPIVLNLMGENHEIVRGDDYLNNSYDEISCDNNKCGWKGYFKDGSVTKNLETGETRPANWLSIQIDNTTIFGSFSPWVDLNKHITYQLKGSEENYYLLKIDTSAVRIQD